ncbi:MAG TPA: L,D-transpeptidase, partial [Candidatus Dormibacteraeota bacterium]
MSKRSKRGKAEALAPPMAARVAIGVVAVAALGYGLLSRPGSVQPVRKPSATQAQSSSTPVYVAPPVHASAPSPAPLVEPPEAAEGPGALVRQVVDYASRQTPGTVIIDTGNTFLY